MISYHPATENDAAVVGSNLRQSDLEELAAAHGGDPLEITQEALRRSLIAWTAKKDGRPIAVLGAAPYGDGQPIGVVWMLATPEVSDYAREFIVAGRKYMALMAKLYPTLINAVYAKNTASRRWLKKIGFREERDLPQYGKTKQPFVLVSFGKPLYHV